MDCKNKGITLVALVITIIILLILSGITIQALTETGLFEKAKQAANESKYAAAAEKVALAVNASYDETGSLNDNQLKTNLNKIDGIYPKVEEISYDLEVIVDGYKFKISKTGKITGEKAQLATLPENTPNTNAGAEVRPLEGWNTETVSYIKTTDGTKVETLEKVSTIYAVSDGNNNTIPVPTNFYYVGGTIDTGVVISDDERDKNKFINFSPSENGKVTEGIPSGAIYNENGTLKTENLTEEEKANILYGNQFVWIPCTPEKYTKYNWGYSDEAYVKTVYAAEETQIEKYGGFYVGRYEAGMSKIKLNDPTMVIGKKDKLDGWKNDSYTIGKTTDDSKPTSKAGEIPYFHSDYTTAEQMSKRMYKNNPYVNSGLLTGTMWDVMLNYISNENETNKSPTNANNTNYYKDIKSESYWGNYYDANSNVKYTAGYGRCMTIGDNGESTSDFIASDNSHHYGIRTTASTEDVKKKNLYDIAGNLFEWTQEDVSNGYSILRGGSIYNYYTNVPVCYRRNKIFSDNETNNGFRTALYMK